MFTKLIQRGWLRLTNKIPLHTVLTVPFIVLTVSIVGLVGGLSLQSGQHAVDDLATQLRHEISQRIHQHLEQYLGMPHLVNQLNADALALGLLDLNNWPALESHFWHQIQRFDSVSYIGLGTEQGHYLGTQMANDGVILEQLNSQTDGQLQTWETDGHGKRRTLSKSRVYDPRVRPWYQAAKAQGNSVWTAIYAYFSGKSLTISANKPFYNAQHQLLGVVSADLTLLEIGTFLSDMAIGKNGQTFIIERSGLMVATSRDEKPFRKKTNENAVTRLAANDSDDSVTRATYGYLLQHSVLNSHVSQQLEFDIDGQRHYLQVLPFQEAQGLDWLIVVVIPKSDFMGEIDKNVRTSVLLSLLALTLAILIGVLTGRWVVRPILQLNKAASLLAQGNWNRTLDLTQLNLQRQDELGKLAQAFQYMARQLRQSFISLENKNTELKQLDKLKDEFLANTSHELRTPLNGIIGIAESLKDGATGVLPADTQKNLAMIVSSGQRLSALVNEILDFSKLRHNNIELDLKALALHDIADVVLTLNQVLAKRKNLRLINQIDDQLPLVAADENRLQQIFYNLLGNAIKFTDHGEITLSAKVEDNRVWVCVADTGIGIASDQLSHIFDSFAQADGSDSRRYGGTGLGLAITRQLLALHGGDISVESERGQGSRFYFSLPLADAGMAQADEKKSTLNHLMSVPLDVDDSVIVPDAPHVLNPYDDQDNNQFNILVVDDESINRQVLVNYLSLHHYQVEQAHSGQQALEKLATGYMPDLVLLDVMMPQMTGFEVTRTIRQSKGKIARVLIVLLTAKNQVENLVTGLDVGANDYLTKPISKEELLARIRTHIRFKQERVRYIEEREAKNVALAMNKKINAQKNELTETLTRLQETQQQLVESKKMASLGKLVAGVAHEINTPIGIGVTAASRFESLTKNIQQLLDNKQMKRSDLAAYLQSMQQGSDLIVKNLQRAAQLIKSFKQVSVDQSSEQQRKFDLHTYLEEILTSLRPSFKHKPIELTLNCEETVQLNSFPGVFSQIITNLLMNSIIHAFDFEQQKSGSIQISTHIATQNQVQTLVLIYQDDGKGMNDDVKQHIFDPFFTTNRQGGGSGLGLHIVYNLVTHKLGGSIQCESQLNQGTRFILRIPL